MRIARLYGLGREEVTGPEEDGAAQSGDEVFAMHCKYGGADDFEGRTHRGTPRKSGDSALLQGAKRRVEPLGSAVKKICKQDYVIDDPAKQRLAAEEYIAYLAQKEVKPSWWREMLQKIRMALAKLPLFREVFMTDRQIELLLARAGRKMRSRNNRAAVDVMWGGNKALNVGDEEGVRMSLFDNPVKKSLVIDALKK